ncbi:hypothetical protein X777_05704 [Ooceraea biroi]|uniref:Uncharacterized protein n=1 Tax=Ooceraea biroi TaxID=2015173 RepID=A0A026WF41_OOCBI|nr:hypothetical protein X777_05704 [Ooceraea biroi]
MKKLALFVLGLAAAVNADYGAKLDVTDINDLASRFDTDVATVQECLDEVGTTVVILVEARKKWWDMHDNDDIDDETKTVFLSHNSFIACMLEKKEMNTINNLYLFTVNENREMSREDRAFDLVLCAFSDENER